MAVLESGTVLDARLDPECLPQIEAMERAEQFKASKSLESYNFMVSAFITNFQGDKMSDKYVETGKVRHEGTIFSPHCIGCIPGRAKTCSDVTGVLFCIEASTRIHGQLACTQMKCSQIIPSYVKEVPHAPISEINLKFALYVKVISRPQGRSPR